MRSCRTESRSRYASSTCQEGPDLVECYDELPILAMLGGGGIGKVRSKRDMNYYEQERKY
jgi:hypothetical protein